MGDVVVTARRLEENIQDVPLAVTALSQARLDALVVDNISDLNKIAPGLQINGCTSGSLSGGTMCQVNIRGFQSTRNTELGSIAVYFADAPGMFTSNFDLQNIQVLKGPQGTLFGDTTTGGALLYTPRKPSGHPGGFISAEFGNFMYHEITGAYENQLLNGGIMFRVAGQYRRREGYVTANYSFGGTRKVADVDQLYLRASLVLKPFDWLENYTVGIWQRDRSAGGNQPIVYTDPRFFSAAVRDAVPNAAAYQFYTGSAPPAGRTWSQIALDALARQTAAGPDEVWSDLDQRIDRQSAGIVNQTRIDFTDNIYLRNIYAVRWIPRRSGGSANYDGTDAPILQITGFRPDNAVNAYDGNYATLTNGWNNRLWSDEVQVVGSFFDNRLQLQGGFFYRDDRAGDFYGDYPYPQSSGARNQIITNANIANGNSSAAACAALQAPVPCYTNTRFSRRTEAYYAQGTFGITEALNLTAGIRHSKISTSLTETAVFRPVLVTTVVGAATATQPLPVAVPIQYSNVPIARAESPGYKSTTYTLTADWRLNDDVLVYLAHRKGFKPGGTNTVLATTDPLFEFKPESLKDVELGIKADWQIGSVTGRTNVAAYKIWYDQIQTRSRVGGGINLIFINGGKADFKGFEFETTVNAAPWFSISANVSYQHNRYTEYDEVSTCAGQPWRQVAGGTCFGLPGNTPILINHAKGILLIQPAAGASQTYNFRPDRFFNVPLTWSIRPEIRLVSVVGEDISAAVNIYHSSGETGFGAGPSNFAGVTPFVVQSWTGPMSGLDAYSYEKYTNVDLNVDWRRIKGSQFSAYLRITNITNNRYRVGAADTFVSGGTGAPNANEPRMALVGIRYDF